MSGYWLSNWQVWVSAFCVLSIYTYLFRDNGLYRLMMQVFIGVNLGYQAIVQWRDVLYPQWWLPMIDGFKALFGGPGSPWGALWSVVGVIGLLFYLQLSRKYASFSKIAIGITIGIGAGLTFKSQLGQNIPQLLDSFRPLAPAAVRPQPKVLVPMPGSAFAPAVDGSLAFFLSSRGISANETLGGVQIWSAQLPSEVTGPATVADDGVYVPTEGAIYRLDRSSGRIVGRSPAPPRVGPAVGPVVERGDRIGLPTVPGTVKPRTAQPPPAWVWSTPGRLVGQDDGRVFAMRGDDLLVLDGADGKLLASLRVPGVPQSTPAVATYRQPQFANGVLLVPFDGEILAFAIRDGIAEGVRSGDLLWRAPVGAPVVSVNSFDGVALVTTARASAIWDVPSPQARLAAGDYFDNWVTVITIVCVMTYFFFSFRRRGPVTAAASNVGRWMLMIGFGAF
ncbi:MAG TPA: PQQ-binding-like beta-propeller repeat protein, partial [Fimbriimonadaceae bacterium]|nr:PQQ-binding-like beta-propeller repeat protein [Fimbriimonadaceae bacterium]